jgi:TPR repeat protein
VAKRSFRSWIFPLLLLAALAEIPPAAAKPRDLSLYPLRVHIFESEWKTDSLGGRGSGMANLVDGQDVHGFEFSYFCPINYMKSVGNQAYAAKWKKPGKTIEIVGGKVGDQDKSNTCEFKITLHEFVYDLQNGTLTTFTPEQYKVRVGMALPKAITVDGDPSHYPIRLSVLDVSWAPPLNGTRNASGRGNLRLPTGMSSVDFTSDCNVVFPVNGEGRYYPGRWTQEGSTLTLLLVAGGTPLSCTLKTSVHTDVYVRDSTGSIKAISAEEYRRTVMKLGAPAAPAPIPVSPPAPTVTPESSAVQTSPAHASDGADTQTTVSTATDDSPLPRTPGSAVVVTEPGKRPGAGPGSAQAVALYLKACDAGAAISCRNLALMYANGTGVPQDYARAAGLYRKACNGGDSGGCTNLGLLYANGTGVSRDYTQAATLYRKACDAGSRIGCGNLAVMYANGTGMPQDYAQAAVLDRKACNQGLMASCSNLGLMYADGTGVPKDYDRAVSFFREACDSDSMVSCSNLGLMYANGTGVSRDYARAVTLYRKACDAGLIASCGNLAIMLENGTGVAQDYVEAAMLYRKACGAGIVDSCVNLGNMYEKGTGVSQDHTQAASLFRKACDGGSAGGCNNLGVSYEKQTSAAPSPK